MLTLGFLAVIIAVPVVQTTLELIRQSRIQALTVFTNVPTRANLEGFEKDLVRQSIARKFVKPRLQLILSRDLGFGTTRVILGREGWLFYRPGIDWLTGPGLLDATRLAHRKRDLLDEGEANPSPDPLPAIRAFHQDCQKAGVHLVVVPVPDKATLQAAELTSRFDRKNPGEPPVNGDYRRFLEDLRASGVDVFDPTPKVVRPGDPPRFLRQDTHWTPEWMEAVAHDLADYLKTRIPALRTGTHPWHVEETQVSRVGDLVELLELPEDQRLYPPQTVTIHRVIDPGDGRQWQSRAGANVLLVGDSYSNIYGTPDLDWGEAAGFPAQLARFLNGDVDVIARSGSGTTATRRELAHRPEPLAGKAVLIWEFAARELFQANWEIVPMTASRPGGSVRQVAPPSPASLAPLLLEGTIVATSRVPQPFTVPYKDCLTYVKLRVDRVVEGTHEDDQVIAVFWGMKDNVRLPAADYAVGKQLRLKLVPIRKAPVNLKTARSSDDLDDYQRQPYYVLEEQAR